MSFAAGGINSLNLPLVAEHAVPTNFAPSKENFRQALSKAGSSGNREAVRTASIQFVSTAFVAPVLALLRQSPMAASSGPFAPGPVEKRFGSLLDQRRADQIVQAARFPLVEAIVDRVIHRAPPNTPMSERAAAKRPEPPLPQGEGWGEGEVHGFKLLDKTEKEMMTEFPSQNQIFGQMHASPSP